MTSLDRGEFSAGYLLEAEEHVRSATRNLLAVESCMRSGAPQHRHVRELFRSLHTLKGLSAMVGIEPIVDLAHEMEAILRDADRSAGKLGADAVELLLQGTRAIEQRVAAFADKQPVAAAPRKLIEALAALQPRSRSAPAASGPALSLAAELARKLTAAEHMQLVEAVAAGRRALRVDFYPSPARSAAGLSITSVRERLGALGEVVRVIPQSVPKTDAAPGGLAFALLVLLDADPEALARALGPDGSTVMPISLATPLAEPDPEPEDNAIGDALSPISRSFVRVDVARLDETLDRLSALVVTRFKLVHALNALRERGVDVRELAAILQDNQRQLRDLRAAITRTRMVSVGELLERVPLIVRELQRATGKAVRLVVDAGQAELDKSVAEHVFPAIVHLVRNAVDHAIESPAERQARGKPAEGTITVSCFEHSNTLLEIRVSDDGSGIDAASIARRAGRPVPQDDRGLLELISLPGLSTRDAATNQSGRGMGMDIVHRIAVDVLGGELSLRTTPGQGSTFTLRLPMSISILDSISFVCGEQAFAVPVSVVEEIIDLQAEQIVRPPHARLSLLDRRGETIPLIPLDALLELVADHAQPAHKALIVRPQGLPCAFAIDRLLGQQEIVVRPIDDPLVKVTGVAGTTDLGDGRPTLVLDLIGLSAMALRSAPLGASA